MNAKVLLPIIYIAVDRAGAPKMDGAPVGVGGFERNLCSVADGGYSPSRVRVCICLFICASLCSCLYVLIIVNIFSVL